MHCLWYDAPAQLDRPVSDRDRPARGWSAALPLGNGRMGAMIYGGVPRDQVLLNEKTVWAGPPVPVMQPHARDHVAELRRLLYAGRHFDAERYCQRHLLGPRISPRSYQPAGYLAMELGHGEAAVSGYRRQLDLRTAVATVAYRCAGVRHRREAFVSAADDVVVLRFDSDAPGVGATFALQHPAGESCVTDRRSGAELVMTARAGHGGRHAGVRFAVVVRLIVDGDGGPVDTPESLGVRGARSVTVLTAIATDYRLDDPSLPLSGDLVGTCRRRLDDAAGRPYAELRARHESDHARLFGRVDFQIAVDADRDRATDARVSAAAAGARDPGLLLLYFHYCRYLFISASRPGTLPANLQGVWNPLLQAPWHSDYHLNVNLQEAYWLAEPLALPECHEPLFHLTERLGAAGGRAARELGCRGFFAGVDTDAWGYAAVYGEPVWGMWLMGAAWCAQHMIDHYRFTQDRAFLSERAYPLLRECALFLLDWLAVDADDGSLVSGPGVSPENQFLDASGRACSLSMGCACDQETIWHTFDGFIEAAEALEIDDGLLHQVRAARDRLALPAIGSDGRIQEWRHEPAEVEPGHRHVSHLYGLMPGYRVQPDRNPELARAALRSVEHRLRHDYDAQGWSLGWIAAILARLRLGDRALELIERSFARKLYPNLFVDAHGQVQVGDMMGVAAAITEMLLQSHAGVIHLLPALPAAWADGSFRGFRARGACSVDARWRDGVLIEAVVRADVDGRCRVRYGSNVRDLETRAGGSYTLRFRADAASRVSRSS